MQHDIQAGTVVVGITQGTRLWAHEVAESFTDAALGQTVCVKSGPFRGKRYTLVGKLANRFDKFFFVDPRTEQGGGLPPD